MTPDDVVKAIERVVEQHKHAGDATALGKLRPLLKQISKLTIYTDELISNLQEVAERFYYANDREPEQFRGQHRHELLAAVYRLKSGMDMMRDEFPPGLNSKG